MSTAAMAWVFCQDIGNSAAKFLLLCLADNADETGCCYPSLETLCRKTNQDRKTVISNLDLLIEIGMLCETGRIVGRGVKVYKMLGLPSSPKHYTYRVFDADGNFYIGVRSCFGDVETDPYLGSGSWAIKQKKTEVKKEILAVYATRKEAEMAEIIAINNAKDHPGLRNKQVPNPALVPKTEPVPDFRATSTKFPSDQYQISAKAVPNLEPRTIIEPSLNKEQNHKALACPLDVAPEVFQDWLAHRKLKKAHVSETVLAQYRAEATKAGWTLQQALVESCARGWTGFKASFVAEKQSSAGMSFAERDKARKLAEWNEEKRRAGVTDQGGAVNGIARIGN